MDLDKEFVRAILKDGESSFRLAIDKGITSEHLLDEGKIAWEFITGHKRKYGGLPSKELVIGSIVDSGGQPADLSAGLADSSIVLIDKIVERRVLNILVDGSKKVSSKITQRNALEAAEAFNEIHRKLQKESLTASKIENLFSLGTSVMDHYDLLKSGKKGIPTPWQSMDEMTMGWWPEDLILFVGRVGSGKTWSLLLLVHSAWKAGHKCLVAATEMSAEKLAARFLCLHLRIPYGDYSHGRLGDFIERRMRDGVSALMRDQGIDVIGGGFEFTIDNLETAIDDARPDLLAVDGAYLIKNSGKDRHERVSNTFDDLKRINKKKKIVTIANTQFNRTTKQGQESTVSIENIGITDVASWNSDGVFGLYQSDDMKKDKKTGIKGMKVREGLPKDFISNWDLDRMDFTEVPGTLPPGTPPAGGLPTLPSKDSVDSIEDDGPLIPF